jgi:hypothetical protein
MSDMLLAVVQAPEEAVRLPGAEGARILVSYLSSGLSRACEFGSCPVPELAGTTCRIAGPWACIGSSGAPRL